MDGTRALTSDGWCRNGPQLRGARPAGSRNGQLVRETPAQPGERWPLHVLLVEDDPGGARLVRELLNELPSGRPELTCVPTLAAAVEQLAARRWDAVLLDLSLPDSQGLHSLRQLRARAPELPIVILTGLADEDVALEAMESGAQDFLIKGHFNTGRTIQRVLRYAVRRQQHEWGLRLLAQAGAALASAWDYTAIPQTLAALSVPALADRSFVDVLGADGATVRLGMASVEASASRAVHAVLDDVPVSSAIECAVRQVLQTGQVAILAQAHGAWHLANLPLVARGRTLGCLTLARAGGPAQAYTSADIGLAEQLAQRAALALDNAVLLRDANEAVRARDEALRVRDDVLRFASHDLKNPLASMRQHTEVLLDLLDEAAGPQVDDEAAIRTRRGLQRIEALTLSMWGLVNELLDTTQLQAGRALQLDRASVDLTVLARAAVESQRGSTRRHRIRLVLKTRTLLGRWDAARLRRVLDNLLGNATKYSPNGGRITVTLSRQRWADATWAVLSVEDQGIGIPAAELDRVFEPFYRAHNVPAHLRGTGIGLAGARHVIHQHGGRLTVRSTEGQGTTFTLCLPLDPPRSRAPRRHPTGPEDGG
jgi:signal transduction histidine kinase